MRNKKSGLNKCLRSKMNNVRLLEEKINNYFYFET